MSSLEHFWRVSYAGYHNCLCTRNMAFHTPGLNSRLGQYPATNFLSISTFNSNRTRLHMSQGTKTPPGHSSNSVYDLFMPTQINLGSDSYKFICHLHISSSLHNARKIVDASQCSNQATHPISKQFSEQ